MTGFARSSGSMGFHRWAWELKTVNAKGLDIRLKMPPAFDAIDAKVRALLAGGLTRGSCHATLTIEREASGPVVRVNQALLASIARALREAPALEGIAPASMDGLMKLPGVIELVSDESSKAEIAALHAAVEKGLAEAILALRAMRQAEGANLAAVLETRFLAIARLTRAADQAPARKPEAIRAKLTGLIAALLDTVPALDPVRLHQEAVLLATKADIREELDRLMAHVAAARQMVETGGPVGRRLDFLAQEFAREANTLCAKANDVSLTSIGLDLKTEIEQFREQIQNLE